MAEKRLERQAVENPFEERMQKPVRAMAATERMPRSAFQKGNEGAYIAEALINFAGVGGKVYTSIQNKKIEADKVIQTGRALLGASPTNEATLAGYRTHAAITLKAKTLQAQVRLNKLAKSDLDKEAWEAAVEEEYSSVDTYMRDNYINYEQDTEIQKLVPLSFREMMPQLIASKEADKVDRKIKKRVNDASDVIISIINLSGTEGIKVKPEDIVAKIDQSIKGLYLTSAQKDEVVLKAIMATESPELIEASKLWKGDRKTSLYQREGSIQKIEGQLKNQEISNNAVSLSAELISYKNGILSGQLTLENGLAIIDKRNKQLDGKFVTRGAVASIISDYQKQVVSNYKAIEIKRILGDQSITDAEQFKPGERQAGYSSIYSDLITKAESEAKAIPEDKREEFIKTRTQSAISKIADMAVTKDDTVEPFVKSFANLASSNVAARQKTGEVGNITLDDTTRKAITILDSMSPMAKYKHLEVVGGKEARVIRAFMAYRERGLNEVQALAQAQSLMTNPFPPDLKRIRKGVSAVRDKLDGFLWFGDPDFQNNQEAYLEEEIQRQIELSPEPDADINIDSVSDYFKSGWTTAGSLRLKGTPGYLSRAIGMNVDKLEDTMKGFIWSQKDIWSPQISSLGLDESDIFPVTDTKRGTIQIMARSKVMNANMPLGKPIPLNKVRGFAEQYKVEEEKKADKEKAFDEAYDKVRKERNEGKKKAFDEAYDKVIKERSEGKYSIWGR